MNTKEEILERFSIFSVPTGGIGGWITTDTDADILTRLSMLDVDPLSFVQLNQLLVLGHEAPVSDGFFRYYWTELPRLHPYPTDLTPGYSDRWVSVGDKIIALEHLKWGLYRLYVDALLYFGNVRTAFRKLRNLSKTELQEFFSGERYDTDAIKDRGPSLPLRIIARDSRYLISEQACKSYDGDLRNFLLAAYRKHVASGNRKPLIRDLLEKDVPEAFKARQGEFVFSADEVLDEHIESEDDLAQKYDRILRKFTEARKNALDNTRYYLSMLTD